jgi:hypothetical protein
MSPFKPYPAKTKRPYSGRVLYRIIAARSSWGFLCRLGRVLPGICGAVPGCVVVPVPGGLAFCGVGSNRARIVSVCQSVHHPSTTSTCPLVSFCCLPRRKRQYIYPFGYPPFVSVTFPSIACGFNASRNNSKRWAAASSVPCDGGGTRISWISPTIGAAICL